MTAREAVLVHGCSDEAVAAMTDTLSSRGVAMLVASSLTELLRETVSRTPAAIVLGVQPGAFDELEAISVLHAMRARVPVIIVAREDSLELERKAREENIFYYLVEPIQTEELDAVIEDMLRYGKSI